MSSFFLHPKPSKDKKKKGLRTKRAAKVSLTKRQPSNKKDVPKPKKKKLDEDIQSDSGSEIEDTVKHEDMFSLMMEGNVEEETAQEKRLRLAKEYLSQLEDKERELKDDKLIDHDAIAHRLRQEVLEGSGRLIKTVADSYKQQDPEEVKYLRGHKLTLTCVVVGSKHIFTASKDCCIMKWDLSTGSKLCVISGGRRTRNAPSRGGPMGHTGHVLALAISSDEKFLASGGLDHAVRIWDAETCNHLHSFKGHRDTVTGLVFQKDAHQLFSCSTDRTIKLWNIDEMSYIETLFGHQDPITGIDCLARERPISSGGCDKSVRSWKIVEESQLVYLGHQ
jgi:ribosomal RNA-processing protein 9